MFKLILMPIGNMIGRLLMPYVIKMARKTTEYLSKFGNAGPEQMADVMAEGVSIAIESMVEMLTVVMTKVLWPLFKGLVEGIGRVIAALLSGQGFDLNKLAPPETGVTTIGDDLKKLMGNAAYGMSDVINTFGLTVQTGNRQMGNSFAESATAFYKGTADIANGLQSVHTVLVVGTTKAIEKMNEMFNLQTAGFVTIIDTVKTPFIELVPLLDNLINTLKQVPEIPPEYPPTETEGRGKFNLGKAAFAATLGAAVPIMALLDKGFKAEFPKWLGTEEWFKGTGMATGGIVTRPTRILAGEAGPEAIVPLDRAGNAGGQTINVHFHGDVYGMDDFERKIEKTVSKYGGKVRGAY
jgi:hypothetical protein